MIVGISILLLFQLMGEVIAYFMHGLVPGPVVGMALIFVALCLPKARVAVRPVAATVKTSRTLIANLGVLFVPAGVGIVKHLHLIADKGIALLATVAFSTVVTLIVTVWCYLAVKRLMGRPIDG